MKNSFLLLLSAFIFAAPACAQKPSPEQKTSVEQKTSLEYVSEGSRYYLNRDYKKAIPPRSRRLGSIGDWGQAYFLDDSILLSRFGA